MKSKMIIVVGMFVLAVSVLSASADMLINLNVGVAGTNAAAQFQVLCTGNGTSWALGSPKAIYNNYGSQVGTLKDLTITSDADPYVNLYFSYENDTVQTETLTFHNTLSFTPLVNPTAYATAAITLTSDDNGATIGGLFPGGKAYEATYNGGSTVFADLVSGFGIGDGTSWTNSQRFPASGSVPIVGTVSDITSTFSFTLTDGDQASGTSRFEVTPGVPEPATMSLLFMGGMAVLARRNRTKKLN
jgi:hypothetical protein